MRLNPLKFGSVEIDFPVVLAPMAGYTDAAMRTLCLGHGAGAVYTELTSAEGIRRDSRKTFQVLDTAKGEHPIAGHIFGRDPKAMVAAAKYVERTGMFDWIDINCGCPVKKVVSRGAGAALLKELPLMGEIIEKLGCSCDENRKEVPRLTVGRNLNGLPVHPNQVKVRRFVYSFGLSGARRGHLRDAVSYARATKGGGWYIRTNAQGDAIGTPLSKRRAVGRIAAWDRRHSAVCVGEDVVRAAVDFVYGDPEL